MFSLLVVQPLPLVLGLVAYVHPQTLVQVLIHLAEYHRKMGPAAFQPGQLLLGQIGDGVGQGADAQGNKHLVAVKPGIFVAQAAGLQAADGLKDLGGNEVQLLIDASQSFQGVEQQGGGGSDLVAGLAGDDPAVRQNHGSGGSPGGLRGRWPG